MSLAAVLKSGSMEEKRNPTLRLVVLGLNNCMRPAFRVLTLTQLYVTDPILNGQEASASLE